MMLNNNDNLKKHNNISAKRYNKSTLMRLGRYIMRYRMLAITALILSVSGNVLALLGPMLSGYAIDAIAPGVSAVDFKKVFFYCGLMAIFYIISALFAYILSLVTINLSQKIIYQMRTDIFDKLMKLPVSYFDNHKVGDIISRISYDVDTVNASLSNDLLQIFTTVITVIFSFASMLYLSPMLLLAFVITIPMSIFFTRYKATQVKPFFRKRSAKLGELNGFVEEIISGQKTIKAYNKEDYTILRFDSKNKDAVDAYYDADYNGSVIGPSVNFINNISLSLISTLGAILYLYNMSTLGNISAFILYSRKFSGPINELANITSELQSAFAAAERIFNLLDEPEEISDVSDAIDIDAKGQVDFHNVCFSYDENVSVIDNLNLHVEPGELVAIVGPTGAGKTTIVNLLMRFYDTNSGKILLDGIDIHNITRKSLRKSFTMVLQDTWLFSGSIYDNLAYGNPYVTYEDVVKAAKIAGIDDYIESLPDGYNTILSDDGVNISKGQKQLLTIARALLSSSKILILDEATSNVDTRTEKQIQNAMYSLMQGRTCFVIAHRLSTIQNADKIVVINKGQISEQGTHDELMAKKGYYYTLYSSQFV